MNLSLLLPFMCCSSFLLGKTKSIEIFKVKSILSINIAVEVLRLLTSPLYAFQEGICSGLLWIVTPRPEVVFLDTPNII